MKRPRHPDSNLLNTQFLFLADVLCSSNLLLRVDDGACGVADAKVRNSLMEITKSKIQETAIIQTSNGTSEIFPNQPTDSHIDMADVHLCVTEIRLLQVARDGYLQRDEYIRLIDLHLVPQIIRRPDDDGQYDLSRCPYDSENSIGSALTSFAVAMTDSIIPSSSSSSSSSSLSSPFAVPIETDAQASSLCSLLVAAINSECSDENGHVLPPAPTSTTTTNETNWERKTASSTSSSGSSLAPTKTAVGMSAATVAVTFLLLLFFFLQQRRRRRLRREEVDWAVRVRQDGHHLRGTRGDDTIAARGFELIRDCRTLIPNAALWEESHHDDRDRPHDPWFTLSKRTATIEKSSALATEHGPTLTTTISQENIVVPSCAVSPPRKEISHCPESSDCCMATTLFTNRDAIIDNRVNSTAEFAPSNAINLSCGESSPQQIPPLVQLPSLDAEDEEEDTVVVMTGYSQTQMDGSSDSRNDGIDVFGGDGATSSTSFGRTNIHAVTDDYNHGDNFQTMYFDMCGTKDPYDDDDYDVSIFRQKHDSKLASKYCGSPLSDSHLESGLLHAEYEGVDYSDEPLLGEHENGGKKSYSRDLILDVRRTSVGNINVGNDKGRVKPPKDALRTWEKDTCHITAIQFALQPVTEEEDEDESEDRNW